MRRRARAAVMMAGLIALSLSGPAAYAADPQPSALPTGSPHRQPTPSAEDLGVLAGQPIVLPHDGSIVVQTIRSLAAASTDNLGLNQPPPATLLIPDAAKTPAKVYIGPYTAGTALEFYLTSSFTGQTYLSTGNNARVYVNGSGDSWTIAWEDWTDFNYMDVHQRVCYFAPPTTGCPRSPDATFGSGSFGNGSQAQATQGDPVNSATGNYYFHATDAHLPGRGLAFDFVRSYNSLATDSGVLGRGWTHSYAARIIPNADGSATFVAEDGAKTTYAADGAGGFFRPPGAYGVLAPITGGYELKKRDQVRYRFDTAGVLQWISDRNSNTITLAYTAGQLTTITDTVGRQVGLTYHPDGKLATLSFPPSRTVSYTYHPNGLLHTVTDARGGVTTYAYDAGSRLERTTDQNGHDVITNIYGPDGRVIEQIDARGFHTTYDWDPATETSTMTDARGGEWVDDYDAGILMSRRDPEGNLTRYAYSAELGLSAVFDARGLKTETNVDSFGNMTLRKWPAPFNYQESWTYNGRNDPLTHTDRRNNTTTFTYDSAGNLKTVTGPPSVSPVTTYNYDPAGTGLLFSVIDPRGKTASFAYDAEGNRNRITTPLGHVTTMTYDPAGRLETFVEARGNAPGANPADYTTTLAYNGFDQLETTTTPLGHVTTTLYDPVGNRESVTDANSHTTTFEYDEANHLTAVVDPDQFRTTYGYDEVGNLTSRTDANTHVTTYAYDLAHRLRTETRPLNRVWTYEYDPNGNLTKVIDPIAAATPLGTDHQAIYAYDEVNRLRTATYWNAGSVTYGYDANDNRTSMSDSSGSSTYAYDNLNRLTFYRHAGRGLNYGYDAAGNVTSRTYTDGTSVALTYDDDGRLETVTSAGATTTYGYDPAGHLTSTALPAANGHVETRAYDRSGRLTEVKNEKGSSVLSRATYVLDPVGNRDSMETLTGTVTYDYDALDRLTEACYTVACAGPGDNFRRYTYDPVGNRKTEVRDTGTTTYTYDDLDQLVETSGPNGTVAYTYDLDGRTLTAGSTAYTWEQPGRLKTAAQAGTTTTYTYDGDGLRFEASTGSQANKKTQFDWDVNLPLPELVAERTGNGSLLRRYVFGHEQISQTSGNNTSYFHYDGLGSVVNLTSSSGVAQWTYAYLPFGGVRSETKNHNQAPANLSRFAGEYLDSIGLYYLRARQYDSLTGRFLSMDPDAPDLLRPAIGRYTYADANPILIVDPSGRDTNGVCITGEGALGFLFGEFALCVVVSDTGQGGVILTEGAGGGVGSGATAGISLLHADAAEIYDLEGPFVMSGGSGAVLVGIQGEAFAGPGHCGQVVAGAMAGPVVGGTGSFQVGATSTNVLFALGTPKSGCSTK